MDLNTLAQQLNASSGAAGELDVFKTQAARAKELRGTNNAAIPGNKYGHQSLMGGVVDAFNHAQGVKLGRTAEQGIRDTSSQVGAGDTAKTLFNATLAKQSADAATKKASINPRASGSRFLRSKSQDPYGNDVVTVFDKATGEEKVSSFGNGAAYTEEEAARKGGLRAGQKGDEAGAAQAGKNSENRQDELVTSSKSNMKTLNSIDQAINALEGGANSGPLQNMVMPFKASTIALRNARDNMALTDIGEHTFGSLSEAEGEWLKGASMPPLDEDELLPYMQHRRKATLRVLKANEYERRALENGDRVNPALILAILGDGGFDIREYGYRK